MNNNIPMKFYGGSAAQSALLPFLGRFIFTVIFFVDIIFVHDTDSMQGIFINTLMDISSLFHANHIEY